MSDPTRPTRQNPPASGPASPSADWRFDTPVHQFVDTERGGSHAWTVRDSFEGVQVFGATGSGKSSGSGRALALGLLRANFGGLVLTAKPTDARDWAGPRGYMAQAGRKDRPIVVGPPSRWKEYESWGVAVPPGGHRLDFLTYEFDRLQRAEVNPSLNLVSLFETAVEIGRPQESGPGSDPFWQDTFRQLLQNAVDLAIMADGAISLIRLKEIVMTLPQTQDEAFSPEWRAAGGACWECLNKAQARFDRSEPPPHYDEEDLRQVATYWLIDMASLAFKTRSSIRAMFTSRIDFLLRSPLRQIFSAGTSGLEGPNAHTFAPDATHNGRVVILDFPIKSFGEIGRFVQILYKTLWQMSTEDRAVTVDEERGVGSGQSPVFLWADESQYFVTVRDLAFQLTARSKCAATVYLTQNLPNYYAMLKGADSRSVTDSLVGNLQTKIFHANGDPTTNSWAEMLFGQYAGTMRNQSASLSGDHTMGRSQSLIPVVHSREFVVLRKGGEADRRAVSAVMLQAGRRWHGEDLDTGHLLRTQFMQG
jgi:hypothetical protein